MSLAILDEPRIRGSILIQALKPLAASYSVLIGHELPFLGIQRAGLILLLLGQGRGKTSRLKCGAIR